MSGERTHVSINVSSLDRAVDFYRAFFGVEPTKRHKDYAKFEIAEPPLVLSLEPVYHRAADSFNHLGIRLGDESAVLALHERLRGAGFVAEAERDVECCYSRQTKFWLLDPDKNLWEIYALTGELERRGALSASDALAARDRGGVVRTWEHRLGDPVPERLTEDDGSMDEVRLRGTLNTPGGALEAARMLGEARRVLRPGGRILIHGLVSDRPLAGGFPRLPGPAALVRHAPLEHEPVALLEAHGFVGVYLQKLGESPNFKHDGASMRELLVCGWKPGAPEEEERAVVYKGPFQRVVDDDGAVYERGRRVTVSAADLARLRGGPMADAFFFLR